MLSIQGIKLIIINEKPMTTSREIASHFEKQHKVVLHKIENLDCSPQFNEHNFMPVTYQDKKGELRKEYQITHNGFMYLAMGFTGKRAGQFKEAYIHAFDAMEEKLKKLHQTPPQQAELTLDDILNAGHALQKTLVEVTHTKNGEVINVDQLLKKVTSEPIVDKQKSTTTNKPLWMPIVETFFAEIDRGNIPEKMRQNMLLAKETITLGKRTTRPCLFFRVSNLMALLRENPRFFDLLKASSIRTTQDLLAQLNQAGVLALNGKTKEKGIPINPSEPAKTRRVPHLVALDLVVLEKEYGIVLLKSEQIAQTLH